MENHDRREHQLHRRGELYLNLPTCGSCKHWHKHPPNPTNLSEKRGDCRRNPPTATTLPMQNGQVILCSYPNLQDTFPACSQYEEAASPLIH